MSHRRRVLNLVMTNDLTGIYSLRRVNLLSRQNNLFFPTAKAAEDAAADKDPAILFPPVEFDDDPLRSGRYKECPTAAESLEKVKTMQVPPPRLSFQPPSKGWLNCAALSESKTLFVERQSGGAFVYDADARCVVTIPTFPPDLEQWPCWGRVLFPVAGAKRDDGSVYAMDRQPAVDDKDGFKFHALVHRKRFWQLEELSPPPYVDHAAHSNAAKQIVSYAAAMAGQSSDVICVSTEGCGTYCFDTASRAWTKAGDWSLPFAGKIERDRDLGVWLGVLKCKGEKGHHRLYASSDLFTDEDDSKLLHCARDLEPPSLGWHEFVWPEVVSLGSVKFCVVQFFETMRSECSRCGYEDADKSFAVFTGVEVVRCGSDDDHNNQQDGYNGRTNILPPTELRLVMHKSKRYMLTQGNDIAFVL